MDVRQLTDLPERDARKHLDRYVREQGKRLRALLERACAERSQVRMDQFNRSGESLVPLWEWFVQHTVMNLPAEFAPPDPIWTPPAADGAAADPDLAEWSDRIGLYVAGCFKHLFPNRGIRWRLGGASPPGVPEAPPARNQPVLSGFGREMCPRLLVYDLALRVKQGVHAGRTLCDAFEMWCDDVLPPPARMGESVGE